MPSPTRAKKKSAPRAKMPASRTFKVIAGGKEPVRSALFNAAHWQVPESRKTLNFKPSAAEQFAIIDKLNRIIESLSLAAAADVLGIDKSQLDRCRKGKEAISSEVKRRIVDVEYVCDRALSVMRPDEVGPWLLEPEPLLGGSIPLNVLTLRGPGPVIVALDGIAAGVFA